MNKYRVVTEWEGYSRGTAVYEVYADSMEEAKKYFYEGTKIEENVTRDDRKSEVSVVSLV